MATQAGFGKSLSGTVFGGCLAHLACRGVVGYVCAVVPSAWSVVGRGVAALGLAFVATSTALLWLPLLWVVDVASGARLRRCRTALLVTLILCAEVAGIFSLALFSLGSRSGRRARHLLLQEAQALFLFALLKRLYGVRLLVQARGLAVARGRPVVVLLRHVGPADLLVPQHVLGAAGFVIDYVLPSVVVRSPTVAALSGALDQPIWDGGVGAGQVLGEAVAGLGAGTALVICPEGVAFSAAARSLALADLEDAGDTELLRRATRMHHVLPPVLEPTLAALRALPADATVLFIAHRGLEAAATVSKLWGGELIGATVRVLAWTVPVAQLPAEGVARRLWLFEQWGKVEALVRDKIEDFDDDPTIPD